MGFHAAQSSPASESIDVFRQAQLATVNLKTAQAQAAPATPPTPRISGSIPNTE